MIEIIYPINLFGDKCNRILVFTGDNKVKYMRAYGEYSITEVCNKAYLIDEFVYQDTNIVMSTSGKYAFHRDSNKILLQQTDIDDDITYSKDYLNNDFSLAKYLFHGKIQHNYKFTRCILRISLDSKTGILVYFNDNGYDYMSYYYEYLHFTLSLKRITRRLLLLPGDDGYYKPNYNTVGELWNILLDKKIFHINNKAQKYVWVNKPDGDVIGLHKEGKHDIFGEDMIRTSYKFSKSWIRYIDDIIVYVNLPCIKN
jgi:hypothetical protein